jgi:hypothetical protein
MHLEPPLPERSRSSQAVAVKEGLQASEGLAAGSNCMQDPTPATSVINLQYKLDSIIYYSYKDGI